jgi:hypothetical protein
MPANSEKTIRKAAPAAIVVAVALGLVPAGPAFNQVVSTAPQKTQLEIRQVQTRTFDTQDQVLVMKAVLNVLQDDGFIVSHANAELGLISASKELATERVEKPEMQRRFGIPLHAHFVLIEASATISLIDRRTRVRANFQIKFFDDDRKKLLTVSQIMDGNYYQDFFSKVDKGIFIQKEKI